MIKKPIQCIHLNKIHISLKAGHIQFGCTFRCRTQDPGGAVGSTSRGWRLVGSGLEMGEFRVQGVETGKFRDT